MNWELVSKCGIWPELGVSECEGCPSNDKCWPKEKEGENEHDHRTRTEPETTQPANR